MTTDETRILLSEVTTLLLDARKNATGALAAAMGKLILYQQARLTGSPEARMQCMRGTFQDSDAIAIELSSMATRLAAAIVD